MDNLTTKQKEVNQKFVNLEVWRTETEFRAIATLKGEFLSEVFKRISAQYHERLHRIKLSVLRGEK